MEPLAFFKKNFLTKLIKWDGKLLRYGLLKLKWEGKLLRHGLLGLRIPYKWNFTCLFYWEFKKNKNASISLRYIDKVMLFGIY